MDSNEILRGLSLRIREARLARRLTIDDMVIKTGMSKMTYRRIEKGADFVAIKHYLKACIFLDINFEKVIGDAFSIHRKRVRRKPKIDKSEVEF